MDWNISLFDQTKFLSYTFCHNILSKRKHLNITIVIRKKDYSFESVSEIAYYKRNRQIFKICGKPKSIRSTHPTRFWTVRYHPFRTIFTFISNIDMQLSGEFSFSQSQRV